MSLKFQKIKAMIRPPNETISPAQSGPSNSPSALAEEGKLKGPDDDQKHQEKLMKRAAKGLKPLPPQ